MLIRTKVSQRRRPSARLFVDPGEIEVGIGELAIQLQRASVRPDRVGPPAQCLERGSQVERGSRVDAAGPERPAVMLYGLRGSSLTSRKTRCPPRLRIVSALPST